MNKSKRNRNNIVIAVFLIVGMLIALSGATGTAGKLSEAANSFLWPSSIPSMTLGGSGTATFGTTTVGSQSTTLFSGTPRAVQYTPLSSGVVTDIGVYFVGSGQACVAIYADDGFNNPGVLLAQSSITTITSNGWFDFSGFNVPIVGGSPYWLAAEANNGGLVWFFENSGQRYYQGDTSSPFGVFPNPYIPWWSSTFTVSIYAVYIPNSTPTSTPTPTPTLVPTSNPTATPTPTPTPIPQFSLTMGISGQGSVNPSIGTYNYNINSQVSITATPSNGYTFNYWLFEDGTKSYSASSSLDMIHSRSALAVFVAIPQITPSPAPGATPNPTPLPTVEPTPLPTSPPITQSTPTPIEGDNDTPYVNTNEAAIVGGLSWIAVTCLGALLNNGFLGKKH